MIAGGYIVRIWCNNKIYRFLKVCDFQRASTEKDSLKKYIATQHAVIADISSNRNILLCKVR